MDAYPGIPRPLLRICALALAAGLLSACGGDGEAADPGGGGYGAPASDPVEDTSQEVPTQDATDGSITEDTTKSVTTDDPAAPAAAEIVISGFAYQVPGSVPPGAELSITNEDEVGHTVTSDEGTFDVAVGPGETVTLTVPEEPGEYPFHCAPHPAMTATLVIEEG